MPGDITRAALAGQCGAALDMLEHALRACPEPLWDRAGDEPPFWYLACHTLFGFDACLGDGEEGFQPPAPFGLEEWGPAGVMPPRTCTRDELSGDLEHVRRRVHASLAALDAARTVEVPRFWDLRLGRLELLLYNLRHAQHHTGQLQMRLRQAGVEPPRWVRRGTLGRARGDPPASPPG